MFLKPRRAAHWLALGLALPWLHACAEKLTPEECGALLDRYVTVLARSDRAGATDGEILKLKLQAREKAARDPAFRRCAQEVSRSDFECALGADTADRFEQCLL